MNIGSSVFSRCENLEEMILSERISSVPNFFTAWSNYLTYIYIPDSVTSIGDSAFYTDGAVRNKDTVVEHSLSNAAVEDYDWIRAGRVLREKAVVRIVLNKSKTELLAGESEKLTAFIKMYPSDAEKPSVKWKSSADTIVSVDKGIIKALRKGKATITALDEDEKKYSTCEVSVVDERTKNYYRVIFDSMGGSPEPFIQSVDINRTAYEPENPEKQGFLFAGWYTDKNYTTKYDFGSAVTSDITLYAKWEEDPDSLSANMPMDYRFEMIGNYKVSYCHSIPFWGKSKLTPSSFGGITIYIEDNPYEVTKIKANKKRHYIQITGISGVDRKIEKEVKKATKGFNYLSFTVNPYFVKDTDELYLKTKKDGSISTVKIKIFGKYYKAKKNEWSFGSEKNVISFMGSNLDGSYTVSDLTYYTQKYSHN